MKKIAVIPARGGSVSIPLKNIKSFCGQPLIFWCINALSQSNIIDEIVDLGFQRHWVYWKLASKLDYPGAWKSHFSQMYTEEEVRRAINKLKKMRDRCIDIKNKKAGARMYRKKLTLIRQIGRENAFNAKKLREKKTLRSLLKKLLSPYQ